MRVKIRATMFPWFFSISRKIRSDEIKAISKPEKKAESIKHSMITISVAIIQGLLLLNFFRQFLRNKNINTESAAKPMNKYALSR